MWTVPCRRNLCRSGWGCVKADLPTDNLPFSEEKILTLGQLICPISCMLLTFSFITHADNADAINPTQTTSDN